MPKHTEMLNTIKDIVMGNYDNEAPLGWNDKTFERKKWKDQQSKETDTRPLTDIYTDKSE